MEIATERHLRDVDAELSGGGAKSGDDARLILLHRDEKGSVHLRIHAQIAEANETRVDVAEEGSGEGKTALVGFKFDLDDGVEVSGDGVFLFDDLDAAFLHHRNGAHDVDFFGKDAGKESGAEGGSDQRGVLLGKFALIGDLDRGDGTGRDLLGEETKAVGEVEGAAQFGKGLRIERREVDRRRMTPFLR